MTRDPRQILRASFSPRMLVALVMGFASGLPLLLTSTLLQAWMTEAGVDLGTIGLFTLVGLPYTLKFIWAPLLDRYVIPGVGRRRGWLMVAQAMLMLTIAGLGMTHPAASPPLVALVALLLTFFSASQDIVIDAYRRESLADDEQGLGASLYVNGYRVGMLLASGGGLILADLMPFSAVYLLMAVCMLPGLITTLLAPEPPIDGAPPASLREAVVEPFMDFFSRNGALTILLFILLYKFGDTMATTLTTPFYLQLGFSKTDIGAVVKLFGFWATIVGGLAGGVLILRWGNYRSLWIFGILQAISTLGFAALVLIGPNDAALAVVIALENLAGGMGTAAFVAFMANLTNRRFTATQYALLSSLMGVPRVIIASPSGFVAEALGWAGYFILCAALAIPALLLLLRFRGWLDTEGESQPAQA